MQFFVSHVPNGNYKIQNRATDFLRLLPKVDNIIPRQVSSEEYDEIAHTHFPIKYILDNFNDGCQGPYNYACNHPLEQGIRIEDIDPGYEYEETVNIRCEPCPLVFQPGEYVTAYAAGGTAQVALNNMGVWTVDEWFDFIKSFYDKYDLKAPLLLIGASYDKDVLLNLEYKLRKADFKVHTYIDAWSANVTYILKNSICFLGYQSGLNILADNLDTPQVMLYFPFLDKMLYTWCKKGNIDNGKFNADIFTTKPQQVVDKLRLKL
jgi:hypothetical protein